jgi:hypothetical protein
VDGGVDAAVGEGGRGVGEGEGTEKKFSQSWLQSRLKKLGGILEVNLLEPY